MGKLIEMAGQRFGRLVVLTKVKRSNDTRAFWSCKCDCGEETTVSGKYLRNGDTKSCGCLAIERAAKMGSDRDFIAIRAAAVTKHGHKKKSGKTPEYETWLSMKRRCFNTKSKDYPNWGGRGISISDEWNSSFETFLRDMGPRPTRIHQIDRINPNLDYSKDNCRWVTPRVQASENRRNIHPISVDGVKYPSIAAACRHFGVNETAAVYRISTGIPPEIAVKEVGRMKPRRSKESYLPRNHPSRMESD